MNRDRLTGLVRNLGGGPTLETRELAVAALRALDRPAAIEALRDLLAEADPELRCNAAEGLLLIDSASNLPALLPLLKDPVDWVRWNLCNWLWAYGDSRAVDPLLEVLLHDPDSGVRFEAAVALGAIGDSRAVTALKRAKADDFGVDYEGETVSSAAAKALVELKAEPLLLGVCVSAMCWPEGLSEVPAMWPKELGSLKPYRDYPDWLVSDAIAVPYFSGMRLPFVLEDVTVDEIPAQFATAVTNFLTLTVHDRDQAAPCVFKYYSDIVALYGEAGVSVQIDSPAGVWRHVHPDCIYVVQRPLGDQKVYVQLTAECDWEPEHGLQIVFREGQQLIRVSEQDGHLTHADAYDLPDSEERVC